MRQDAPKKGYFAEIVYLSCYGIRLVATVNNPATVTFDKVEHLN